MLRGRVFVSECTSKCNKGKRLVSAAILGAEMEKKPIDRMVITDQPEKVVKNSFIRNESKIFPHHVLKKPYKKIMVANVTRLELIDWSRVTLLLSRRQCGQTNAS